MKKLELVVGIVVLANAVDSTIWLFNGYFYHQGMPTVVLQLLTLFTYYAIGIYFVVDSLTHKYPSKENKQGLR